ncbi:MAG: hypothetical protein JSS76_14795 [Bacteroidetes bacterium]|nr:hypothetical protein [Bacteroidota bacterium]MBS1686012.1 hypothetical protein [Bacteroidota bacterium]
MKKTVSLFALTVFSIYSFAQCSKLNTGEIDGKVQKIATSPMAMAAPMFAHSSISYTPSSDLYIIYFDLEFRDIETIHEGSKILLHFEDKTSIELTVDKTEISEPENGAPVVQNGRIWHNSFSFVLTKEHVAKMKSTKFSYLNCTDADYIYSPKGKGQSVFQEMLACIDKNL